MINLNYTWPIRAVGNLILKVNALSSTVKGVAAVALLLFSARVVYQAGTAWYKRTWRVPAPKDEIGASRVQEISGKMLDNRCGLDAKKNLDRLFSRNDPEELMVEATTLLNNLLGARKDFLTDTQRLRLIPLITKALKLPCFKELGSHGVDLRNCNNLLDLIPFIIQFKKDFPPKAVDFLLELSYEHLCKFQEFIFKEIREGRVFPPHKGVEAMSVYLVKMREFHGQERFVHFLYGRDLNAQADLRERILERAFSQEPLGVTDEEIAYAQIALYFAHPKNAPPEERVKWEKALQKVSTPLLKKCPEYVMAGIFRLLNNHEWHEELLPILAQAFLMCTSQCFNRYISRIPVFKFQIDSADQILKRFFSFKTWETTPLISILQFALINRGGYLSHLEITAILQWIKTSPDPFPIVMVYDVLTKFADAPVFLSCLPLREDLKPHIKTILTSFIRWPEARLGEAQKAFYYQGASKGGNISHQGDLVRHINICDRHFPNTFTPIHLEKFASWLQEKGKFFNLEMIASALHLQKNLVFLRKQGNEFISWVNEQQINIGVERIVYFVTLFLQIFIKMAKDCPLNQKQWLDQPECKSLFETVLTRIFNPFSVEQASCEYPVILLLLGDLARCAPQLYYQNLISWPNLMSIYTPPNNARDAARILNSLASIAKAVAGEDQTYKILDEFPVERLKELCKYPFVSLEEVSLALEAKRILEEIYSFSLPLKLDQPLVKKLRGREMKSKAGIAL